MITRTRNCLLITEKISRMFYNRSRKWREIANPTLPLIFCTYLFNMISLLFHFFSLIQSVRIHAILRYQQLYLYLLPTLIIHHGKWVGTTVCHGIVTYRCGHENVK